MDTDQKLKDLFELLNPKPKTKWFVQIVIKSLKRLKKRVLTVEQENTALWSVEPIIKAEYTS